MEDPHQLSGVQVQAQETQPNEVQKVEEPQNVSQFMYPGYTESMPPMPPIANQTPNPEILTPNQNLKRKLSSSEEQTSKKSKANPEKHSFSVENCFLRPDQQSHVQHNTQFGMQPAPINDIPASVYAHASPHLPSISDHSGMQSTLIQQYPSEQIPHHMNQESVLPPQLQFTPHGQVEMPEQRTVQTSHSMFETQTQQTLHKDTEQKYDPSVQQQAKTFSMPPPLQQSQLPDQEFSVNNQQSPHENVPIKSEPPVYTEQPLAQPIEHHTQMPQNSLDSNQSFTQQIHNTIKQEPGQDAPVENPPHLHQPQFDIPSHLPQPSSEGYYDRSGNEPSNQNTSNLPYMPPTTQQSPLFQPVVQQMPSSDNIQREGESADKSPGSSSQPNSPPTESFNQAPPPTELRGTSEQHPNDTNATDSFNNTMPLQIPAIKQETDSDSPQTKEVPKEAMNIHEKLKEMGEISVKPVSKQEPGSSKKKDGENEVSVEIKKKSGDKYDTEDSKRITNLRKNIREVMDENQLDATTLAAQRQESERLARVQEQQKIIRELQRQMAAERQNNRTQNRVMSLLQGQTSIIKSSSTNASNSSSSSTSNERITLPGSSTDMYIVKGVASEVTFKGSGFVDVDKISGGNLTPSVSIAPVRRSKSIDQDVEPESDKKEVVTIVDSSSEDDCIVLSDDEDDIEDEPEDDPHNSGLHVNDAYNIPDEQGRVVINIGHPENETDIFVAPQIARIIKPHQIGGVRFLFDNVIESVDRFNTSTGFGCILAHSMGLGKTLQLVCFCDIFLRHTDSKSILCIMPINTLQNWVSEFNMWLPEDPDRSPLRAHGEVRPRNFKLFVLNDQHKTLSARSKVILEWARQGGVLLIGYELYRLLSLKLANKKKKGKKNNIEKEKVETEAHKQLMEDIHAALVRPGPDLVICDEGHRIKNSHASISVALKQIRSKRRIVLTGYPLQNNLLEYWCMVDFVRPNYLGTKTEFANMFERPIQNGQCIDSTPQDIKLMRYRAHVLHSLLVGFVQRRSHVVLQNSLPQKEEYVILVRMTSFQRKLYDVFMNEVVRTKAVPNPLKAFAVCCKIWNHPDVLYNFLKKREADLDLELEEAETESNSTTSTTSKGRKKGPAKKAKEVNKDGKTIPSIEVLPNQGKMQIDTVQKVIKEEPNSNDQNSELSVPKPQNGASGEQNHTMQQQQQQQQFPQSMQQQTQPMSSEQYPPQYPPVQQPNQQQQSQIKEPYSQFQNFQQPPVPPKEPALPDPVHGQNLGQQPQQMNYPNQYDNNYNPYNSYGCDNYYSQFGNMYQQPQYGNQNYQSQYTPQNNFWQTDNSNYYGYNQTAQVTPDPYQNDPTYTSTAPKPQEPFDQSSAVSVVRQPLQSDEKSSEIVDLDTKEIKTVETNINSIEIPDIKDSKDSKDSKDTKDIKDAKDIKAEIKIENLDDVSVEKEPIKAKEDGIPYDWALELMKGYIPDLLENSPKMVIFFRLLEESLRLGDRILVFSQSLLTLNLIERFLQKNKVPGFDYYWAKNSTYFRLDGSTTAMDREKLINEFNANPQVHLFLVSTRAGSLGINLVGANRVIVFDASWNPCHDTQAVCRVYRYGQRKPCFVYRIVMDNCLEKKIYDRQVNKQGMSDRVVDECNPDAHLSMKEVTNLCYDEEKDEEIKDFSACKDKYLDVVMQKVIEIHHSLLSKEPFHHESLLVDRKEKKLSQAEKRLAQRGYEMEKRAAAKPAYIYNSMGTQYRVMRTPDGAIVHRPVASVRPMQAEMGEKLPHPVRPGGVRPTRWIPAEVWQRQGMTAQEMTLPLDVVIPTSSGDKSNIVLKAGQKVMVLKSPKGIYMQLESGKIIAIRTSLKVGQNKEKPEESEAGSSKASPSSEESLKGSTKVDDSSDSSLSANASDVASPSSGIVKKDDGIDGNTNATQNVKNTISTADNSKSKTQEFSMQGLFKAAASKPMTQSSKQFNVQNLLDTKSSNQQSGNSFGGQNKNASDDVIMVEDTNQPRYPNKQAFSNVIAKGQLGRNFGFNNQVNRQPVNVHGNSASLMANVKPHFNENKNWMGQKSQSQIQNKSVPPTITIDDDCDPPSRDKVVYKPNLVERKTKGSSRAGALYPAQNFNKTQERQIKPTPSTHQKLAPSTNVKSTDHPVNTSNDTSRQMQNVKPYSRYSFEQGHNISNSPSTQQSELPEMKINTRNQKIPTIKNIPSPYPSISTGLGQSSASSTHQSYQQTNPIQTMATSQTSHHSETTSMSSSCPPMPSFSTTSAQSQPHLTPQQDNSATYPVEKQKENKDDKQQSNIDRTIEATAHHVQPQGQNPVAKEKPDVVENQYQPPTNYNQQLNPATPYVAPQTDPSYMYNRPEHGSYQQPYPGMYSAPVSQSYNYPPQSASSQPTYSYGSYHPHPYDPYGGQNNTAPTYAPPTQTATSNPPSPYHYSGYPPSTPAPPAPDHYNPYYNYPPYPPQTGQWQQ